MKHIRRHLGRSFPAGLLGLLVVALVLALATGVPGSATANAMEKVGLRPSAPDTFDPAILEQAQPEATPAPEPAPVAEAAVAEPGVDAGRVQAQVASVGPPPGTAVGQILDASSDAALYESQPEQAAVPASTMKLLTALTVLDGYGADHRFVTEVRAGESPVEIWLVGGGDPYLTSADLDGLAERTAAALQEAGQTRVDLGVDATGFAGDGWNPVWGENYRSYVAPTEALRVDRARLGTEDVGPRSQTPSDDAARVFADALRSRGVEVGDPARGTAPATDTVHAQVESAPLSSIVEQVLVESDNDGAEMLFRHVGRLNDGDGSIAAAQQQVQGRLTELGVWRDGMVISDGSGLSRDNRVSPAALTATLNLALAEEHPELRAVISGLPVAGAEGTMAERFVESGTAEGRGLVRAKTGTLSGVHTLAGQVRAQDGSILVFAFLLNGADYESRVWLDRVTSALATCGCR